MPQRKASNFEHLLLTSADQALAIARGQLAAGKITVRELNAGDVEITPPPTFTAARVLRVRRKMKLSQTLFASVLNVSPSLVRAWERGSRNPEGAPQRLLHLAEKAPLLFEDLVLARRKHSPHAAAGVVKRVRRSAAKTAQRYSKSRSSTTQR